MTNNIYSVYWWKMSTFYSIQRWHFGRQNANFFAWEKDSMTSNFLCGCIHGVDPSPPWRHHKWRASYTEQCTMLDAYICNQGKEGIATCWQKQTRGRKAGITALKTSVYRTSVFRTRLYQTTVNGPATINANKCIWLISNLRYIEPLTPVPWGSI